MVERHLFRDAAVLTTALTTATLLAFAPSPSNAQAPIVKVTRSVGRTMRTGYDVLSASPHVKPAVRACIVNERVQNELSMPTGMTDIINGHELSRDPAELRAFFLKRENFVPVYRYLKRAEKRHPGILTHCLK